MRIEQYLYLFGSAHPRLGPDCLHPVGEAWDKAQVFFHVLFANPPGRDDAPGRQGDRRPEDRLGLYIDKLCQAALSA